MKVGGRVGTIQTTTLLRTARILRKVLETCCHSNSSERPSANADVKNSNGDNNNNNETHKILCDFEIQTDNLIPARLPELVIVNEQEKKKKKKRTSRIVDFTVPEDPRVIIKENEKRIKFLVFAKIIKKKQLLNMKATVIPIVIGALGTVPRGLGKGLEDLEIRRQVEIIQTTALLRSVRTLRRYFFLSCFFV